ncbi:hypothetical protein [Mycobacterium shimoidei]|uniref:hypothetical protein n=1 Tax=Mycobacterium shimoidei TaxID=29313 RepID=UPI00111C2FAF|nr:hypothetical protein [Mycobacterium shimoidei]MCV7259525.1 hypothetical protein [Mycobacterium shimoidei]
MTDSTVRLSFDHLERSPQVADSIEEQLAAVDATVSFAQPAGWGDLAVHVSDMSPFGAIDQARRAVREVIDRDPVASRCSRRPR